jgi:hypothetical protein
MERMPDGDGDAAVESLRALDDGCALAASFPGRDLTLMIGMRKYMQI